MKRMGIIGGVILMIIAGWFFISRRSVQSKNSASIQTAVAQTITFVKEVTSAGKTKAEKTVDLKFQTSGKLTWVGVKEGQTVVAGQALASLDSREVKKNLEKALRDYSKQRNDFEEMWRVTYRGVDNPDEALTDTVKRILQKNQWDLERAVLDVELKHLATEYSVLVSPIAGIVTHIDTPVAGVNITPATAVFTVVDVKSIQFEATIDETDIGALSVGQVVSLSLDAYPESSFSGVISYISITAQQSSGGATVFPVKIAFGDVPDSFKIGLNGDVTIETLREEQVLVVPVEAIREDKGQSYVYTQSGTSYRKTPVRTGARNDNSVIILDGIKEGDVVVTKGFSSITK